jgi:cobalt-zinc-cadmium efflux system membrane fusion protein
MRRPQIPVALAILIGGVVLAWWLANRGTPRSAETGEAGELAQEAFPKGPHGGRLLEDGDLSLEITIFERGAPPQFRVYPFLDGQPLAPSKIDLQMELERLGGRRDVFRFTPEGDYLTGDHPVEEPHSFDVRVSVAVDGREHHFSYASYENRVELTEEAIAASGITLATAGPATVRTTIALRGRLVPNEDGLAHIMPRFPGITREVRKRLGDLVAKDEVLAIIEANESLHPYEVRSRTSGTVIVKDITPGEFVSPDQEIFVVADLRTVWADLDVYRQDFPKLEPGQRVRLDAGAGTPPAESSISYLSPVGSLSSQTLLARAVVPNAGGLWRPGLFVSAEVLAGVVDVPVAVRARALQTLGPFDVVFVREGKVFQAQPLLLGHRDADWVEVRSGLALGAEYVDTNSFILKADVGKSGASHDH